ncbi:MAG: carbohydrate binding domain-containing protein [Armatimonadota bacterium]
MYKLHLMLPLCLLMLLLGCAASAADLPAHFAPLSLPAQPLASVSEAYADFGALLSRLGLQGALDPASVRVASASGEVVPTVFVPEAGATDRGVVRWAVPANPKAEEPVEWRVYFDAKSARKWEPVAGEVGPANFVANPGFEALDQATRHALGWRSSAAIGTVTDAAVAHSGQSCLKLSPVLADEAKGRWQVGVQTPGAPGVVVEGNRSYGFSYWVKAEDAAPTTYNLVSAAQVYWYRADKTYIKHDGMTGPLRTSAGWTEMSDALQSPADARYVMIVVNFYSSKGALYLDDFSIVPTQRVQLDVAQSADGAKKISLRVGSPNVRRFDFGQNASATWPGFSAVTPELAYAKEAGYGWVGAAKAAGLQHALPDDLARDCVVPAGGCQFAVDLPDGDYRAWLLIGDTGLGGTVVPVYNNWSVKIDGKDVLSHQPDARTWCEQVMLRHIDEWWEPGIDIYDRFIGSEFEEKTVDLAVRGGQAKLQMQGLPLCALAIYPAEVEREMAEELVQLRAARKRSVPVTYEEPARQTVQGVEAADRKRGYLLFSRDLAQPILPGSAPQEGEDVAELSTFLAPGQYDSLRFSLHPLAPVGAVTVTLSDLVGPGGSRIKADGDLDLGVVRYVESSLSQVEYRYTVKPGPIQARNPMPVPEGVTTSWCLRVHAPANAAPGIYRGKLHIAPSNAAASDLNLVVRVVPIKLEPTPVTAGLYHFDHTYWYLYWWRKSFADADGWLREQAFQHERDDFELLKQYNINSLAFCDDLRSQATLTADGDITLPDDHRFVQWMDLYTKAGMGPMPWYGFAAVSTSYLAKGMYGPKLEQFSPQWDRAHKSLISWIKKNEKERGWPEVVIYLSDELSNEGAKGAEIGRQLVQTTKDIPGIRTISSMNGPWERVMLPGLKIAMPNHAFPITEQTVDEIRKADCELWFYNIGNGRVVWGFYPWRMGAKGRFQWYHRYSVTQPWNTFDGDSAYNVTWLTPGKPLPTLELVQTSQGLDDLRYVTALEQAIAKARQSGKPAALKAAAAAQKDLDELRGLLPDNVKLLIGEMDPKEAGRTAIGNFASGRYLDRQRWLVASHTLAVQDALGK